MGFLGGIFGGRQAGTITTDANGNTTYTINTPAGTRSLAGAGRLFGLDLIAPLDIGERSGLVATLAQPNLTAISCETAEFLAGGAFPVPLPGNFAGPASEYRTYGVSLSDTPPGLCKGRAGRTSLVVSKAEASR